MQAVSNLLLSLGIFFSPIGLFLGFDVFPAFFPVAALFFVFGFFFFWVFGFAFGRP